ncbi:MAG: branched-chain amino acid aminotransferase [Nitrospirae bacterium]|nr:MAG: branched-chain amino acid aminotransferase [Nitrospirota bacterium]
MLIYLNNRLVPALDARVSVFDHGFLYGDGIYETMRSYEGVVFMLDEHIRRLHRSASLIGLRIPKNAAGIKAAIHKTLEANSLKNAYIRLTVSRGPGPVGLDPELCKKPTFVIIANEFKEYPKAYYKNGIRLIISGTKRNLKEAVNPQIKSLNFLNNILAKAEAKERGAYEALMLNANGYLTEGTISNIFFISNQILCTPSTNCGILDGITRKIILGLAVKNRIKIKEGRFSKEALYNASETFITNTTMEVMPVSRVDKNKYKVGTITKLLHREYKKEVNSNIGRT